MEVDYVEYGDYTQDNATDNLTYPAVSQNATKSSLANVLVVTNILISVLGLGGNMLVIWICRCKMKTTVLTTWYTSLALSDMFFCALLPFEVSYMISSHWPFGQVLCKLTSSALFLNMYSSVFLLVLIIADRCVLVVFPVWAQNQRTVKRAYGAVGLMWLLSGLLTLPSLIFRKTTVHGSVTQCYTAYTSGERHKAVVLGRFFLGFLIPLLVIVLCCLVIAVKLRHSTVRSNKPYKIMAALVVSFFFCWLPYHTFVLLELDVINHSVDALRKGLKVGATLAAANSFVSPILYVFVGKDFKRTLQRSLMVSFKDAMAEESRLSVVNNSRCKTMDIIEN